LAGDNLLIQNLQVHRLRTTDRNRREAIGM
jgi:hypothetical protein